MNNQKSILDLIHRYSDGIANADEVAQLQATLKDDADARQLFRRYMELDAALTDLGDAATLCDSEQRCGDSMATNKTSRWKRWASVAIISAVAVCLLLAIVVLQHESKNTTTWATVTETGAGVSIVRDGKPRHAQIGDQLLRDEQIVVPQGSTAQLKVAGLGITALGPEARLRCGAEPRLIELEAGFATITAEKQQINRPWRIRTPQVEAAVLGTKFNIASAKGRTALRVSEGLVQLTSLHDGQIEKIRGGNRAFITKGFAPTVASSRSGSVLLLTSRDPVSSQWDKFNQILIDKLVNARMWELGFRVEVKHYEGLQQIDLSNYSLVIVSLFDYDVGEPALERIGLAKADVPVICLEPAAYPVLGMTAGQTEGGFGFIDGSSLVEFVKTTHPLTGGYFGKQDDFIRGIVGWGRPVNDAVLIAHLPENKQQAVLFGYDTDSKMVTFTAPARRVGLFLDPNGISEQSTKSWKIFEAVVDWCVETGSPL